MRKYLHRYYRWRKNRIPLDYKNPSAKREKFALKAYRTSNYASGILSHGMDLTGRENTDEIKKELTLAPPLKNPDWVKAKVVGSYADGERVSEKDGKTYIKWVKTPAEWAQDKVKNKAFMPNGSSLSWVDRQEAKRKRKEAFEARREQWKKDNPL